MTLHPAAPYAGMTQTDTPDRLRRQWLELSHRTLKRLSAQLGNFPQLSHINRPSAVTALIATCIVIDAVFAIAMMIAAVLR
jgi:hypothetical protein